MSILNQPTFGKGIRYKRPKIVVYILSGFISDNDNVLRTHRPDETKTGARAHSLTRLTTQSMTNTYTNTNTTKHTQLFLSLSLSLSLFIAFEFLNSFQRRRFRKVHVAHGSRQRDADNDDSGYKQTNNNDK